jgi:hypothetical protein
MQRSSIAYAAIFCALFALRAPALADQNPPPPDPCGATNLLATTDRPTFGTNPCVVKAANAIIEVGYRNLSDPSLASGVYGFPNARVRAGLFDNVELVIDVPTNERLRRGVPGAQGFSDAGFGLKWEIGHTSNVVYGVAGEAVLPSGSAPFTAQSPSYNGSFQAGWGFAKHAGAGVTLGFVDQPYTASTSLPRRASTFAGAFAVGYGFTPSTKLTAEVANNRAPGAVSQTYGDLFLQQLITQRVLIDVNAGTAFNAVIGSKSHYVGGGIAVHP